MLIRISKDLLHNLCCDLIRPSTARSHIFISFSQFAPIFSYVLSGQETAVAQWLRCCATNRKVAGSIPAGVNGFFSLT